MKSLSAHVSESILSSIDESILASSGAGKAKIRENIIKKCIEIGLKPENITINADNSIDYKGDVHIENRGLSEIPVKFNVVDGDFICFHNWLTTLANSPRIVKGCFSCYRNRITTLEGGPEEVENMICFSNNLVDLKGAPKYVETYFDCSKNQITSLAGCPEKIRDFDCSKNNLTSLEGGPIKGLRYYFASSNNLVDLKGAPKKVTQVFNIVNNPITAFDNLPKCIYLQK